MHLNWKKWNDAFNLTKIELTNKGFEIKVVLVGLDKFFEYCKKNRLKNTGMTRFQFIQQY
jgi:hypothetical protein